LLNACWRLEVEGLADIVVAQVGGSPARQTFGDFAHALASASRVVKAQGKIILISDAAPELGAGAALLRQADTADEALQLLMEHQPADLSAAFQWANAAQRADLYLLTNLSSGIVEEMLATPLSEPAEALRLANKGKCLLLQDAEKTLAIPR
jgi:nickel-dependent lactate racemase